MNRHQKQQMTGLVYIIGGAILVIWTSSLVFQIIAFIVGLLLINTGLQLQGMRSLWKYGAQVWHRSFDNF